MDERPLRLQRRRGAGGGYYDQDGNRYVETAKGWVRRTPEGVETPTLPVVYVGRGSKWGNPYREPEHKASMSVKSFSKYILPTFYSLAPLRGKHLACWCPFGSPCHADVLLHAANAAAHMGAHIEPAPDADGTAVTQIGDNKTALKDGDVKYHIHGQTLREWITDLCEIAKIAIDTEAEIMADDLCDKIFAAMCSAAQKEES